MKLNTEIRIQGVQTQSEIINLALRDIALLHDGFIHFIAHSNFMMTIYDLYFLLQVLKIFYMPS